MLRNLRDIAGGHVAMRLSTLAWIVGALLAPSASAFACQILPPAEQAASDAKNLARERRLAADTAQRADAIFIGTVERVAPGPEFAALSTFRISDGLKGGPRAAITLSWDSDMVVLSCNPADMFNQGSVVQNGTYLVYASRGRILRASALPRDAAAGSLSFDEERAIIFASLASEETESGR